MGRFPTATEGSSGKGSNAEREFTERTPKGQLIRQTPFCSCLFFPLRPSIDHIWHSLLALDKTFNLPATVHVYLYTNKRANDAHSINKVSEDAAGGCASQVLAPFQVKSSNHFKMPASGEAVSHLQVPGYAAADALQAKYVFC